MLIALICSNRVVLPHRDTDTFLFLQEIVGIPSFSVKILPILNPERQKTTAILLEILKLVGLRRKEIKRSPALSNPKIIAGLDKFQNLRFLKYFYSRKSQLL